MKKAMPMASKAMGTVDNENGKGDIMDDYEAMGHFRTLEDAHHIMNDPAKMAKVKQVAGRKMKALSAIDKLATIKEPKKPSIKSLADVKAMGKMMRENKKMGMD